jgi:hypothetical protein
MQAIAYKNGGLKGNWCALYAAIMNPKLSSKQALVYFGIGCREEKEMKKKPSVRVIPIEQIRADYEKGFTMLELRLKYSISNSTASWAVREAGGTIRIRRNRKWGEEK